MSTIPIDSFSTNINHLKVLFFCKRRQCKVKVFQQTSSIYRHSFSANFENLMVHFFRNCQHPPTFHSSPFIFQLSSFTLHPLPFILQSYRRSWVVTLKKPILFMYLANSCKKLGYVGRP